MEAFGTLSADLLRSHHDWLLSHAYEGPKGQLRCRRTNTVIITRIVHRYRLNKEGPSAPFVSDALLENVTASGKMVSFASFACGACNDHPTVPDSIARNDIVSLECGVLER